MHHARPMSPGTQPIPLPTTRLLVAVGICDFRTPVAVTFQLPLQFRKVFFGRLREMDAILVGSNRRVLPRHRQVLARYASDRGFQTPGKARITCPLSPTHTSRRRRPMRRKAFTFSPPASSSLQRQRAEGSISESTLAAALSLYFASRRRTRPRNRA